MSLFMRALVKFGMTCGIIFYATASDLTPARRSHAVPK